MNTLFIDFYHEEVKYIFELCMDISSYLTETISLAKFKIEEALSKGAIDDARIETIKVYSKLAGDGFFDKQIMEDNIKLKTLYNALKMLITL